MWHSNTQVHSSLAVATVDRCQRAPPATSASRTSSWPWRAASSSADPPRLSVADGSALELSSSETTSLWPLALASISAVLPS